MANIEKQPTRYEIIILDDDHDELLFLQDIFAEKGVNYIKYFTDAEECMEYLDQCSDDALPYAIITDLNMPRINGYDFLRWIKERPQYDEIPVIVFSTANTKKITDLCLRLGAARYLVKPSHHTAYQALVDEIEEVRKSNQRG